MFDHETITDMWIDLKRFSTISPKTKYLSFVQWRAIS